MVVPPTSASRHPLRVLIADDQPEVRNALRLLLDHEPGVEVVGEVASAGALSDQAPTLRPDIVLLDWELPGLERPLQLGLVAAREHTPAAGHANHRPRIVALSVWPERRLDALAAGADAFACKGDAPEQLLAALRWTCHTATGSPGSSAE
jgi:DNA-binding NarL/FixJ family response regulator